jgi:pilus assembly protein CpaE
MGIPKDRIQFVANRHGQWRQLPVAQAEAALGQPISCLLPDDPATMNQAINNGRPVVLNAPRAKVARKLTDLSISLNGRMAPDAHK